MATLRQQIVALLEETSLTALDISKIVGVSEKDVYHHLTHIEKSVTGKGRKLIVSPCSCRACGYTFRKRQRLSRPGRCPLCRESRVDHPVFRIES